MKAGYIQYDVKHDREENFRHIEQCLKQLDCDVVVLPELCVCGYLFESRAELANMAEAVPEGPSTQRMLELSKKYGCVMVFGVAEKSGEKLYNTAVVADHGTYIGKYRKIHLSDFEKTLFDRGTENPVFDLGQFKLGVQICFDLWFPEISREQIRQGAGLLCALANFGGETTYIIAQTRAIENLTPLVLCNRIGNEKTQAMDAYFLGKSSIIDAAGNRISVGEVDCEAADSREIEISRRKSNIICRDFEAEISIHHAF